MIIGIGASSYVMRCSVTMDTQDLPAEREIASVTQGSSTSHLKDLWLIAFPHNVKIELTCGVENFEHKTTIH